MRRQTSALILLFALVMIPAIGAQTAAPANADISGKWTASFETQVGVQNYTYEFVVKDKVLTGTITSSLGKAELTNGKVDAGTVTFTEMLDFMGMPIAITYTGKVASADEIKFTRNVADFATEELVAKRAK